MRLKWSRRRKWHRGEKTLRDVYVSLNTGKIYWITGEPDPVRNKGKRYYWWKNWTVHIGGETIGTWTTLAEAQYEAQIHYEMSSI